MTVRRALRVAKQLKSQEVVDLNDLHEFGKYLVRALPEFEDLEEKAPKQKREATALTSKVRDLERRVNDLQRMLAVERARARR